MIKTILFDLDGTLLPMDQDRFVREYLVSMAKRMEKHGYDPKLLISSIWSGTAAMVKNKTNHLNESVFWEAASNHYGQNIRCDEPLFRSFYEREFHTLKEICGFNQNAAKVIDHLKQHGYRLILATNPLFPSVATFSRIHWAGLEPEIFELVTTYENSTRCKPNPEYYWEIVEKMNLVPEECLMVGNDALEDGAAMQIGMRVFLLTDCLINKENADISSYPKGSFPELLEYIREISL